MAKKGLLHFTVRRTLMKKAKDRFKSRKVQPVESETFIGHRPARSVVEFLRRNRKALAAYRRISRNAGKRLKDRTQKRQRSLDLIDTRLMISSWQSTLVDVSETGLSADVRLLNETPYVGFAHPKGTPSSRTFVRIDLPPIVRQISEELAIDHAQFVATMAEAIAADAARSAFIDLTVGGG